MSIEPMRPTTRAEAVQLLRERASASRHVGIEMSFNLLPQRVQDVLYGIAAQLEYIADFIEAES